MDDGYDEDPQLLCEHKHDGDVLDLQVRFINGLTDPAVYEMLRLSDSIIKFFLCLYFNSIWIQTES